MFKESTFGTATPSLFSVSTISLTTTEHFRKATLFHWCFAADDILQCHQHLSIHVWNVWICQECNFGIVFTLLGSFAVMSVKKMIFRLNKFRQGQASRFYKLCFNHRKNIILNKGRVCLNCAI